PGQKDENQENKQPLPGDFFSHNHVVKSCSDLQNATAPFISPPQPDYLPDNSANETSTSRSAAIFSRPAFRAVKSQFAGNCNRATALNSGSPDMGALTISLENSSTFTPARASPLVISRTIPGRSAPTISSFVWRPEAATETGRSWRTTICRPLD